MSKKKNRRAEMEAAELTAIGHVLSGRGVMHAAIAMSMAAMPKPDVNDLGHGFRLEPVPKEELGKLRQENEYKYLFKDGKKVSDTIFRRGGFGGKFKDGYAMLLMYDESESESNWGKWCVVNLEGEIVFHVDKFDHIYHSGGIIFSVDTKRYEGNGLYNMVTGKRVTAGSKKMESKEFIFATAGWGDDFKKGVYKINKKTGEVEIFED